MAPIDGLGVSGFRVCIEDRGDLGPHVLEEQANNFADKGRKIPGMLGLVSLFNANTPQLTVDVDRTLHSANEDHERGPRE